MSIVVRAKPTDQPEHQLDFETAQSRVLAFARPLGVETVPLQSAARRVLASSVFAEIDSPRVSVSAMDRYAIRDVDADRNLCVVGQSFAGGHTPAPLNSGQSVQVFTGAPVPANADRVVMQEDVVRSAEGVRLLERPSSKRHVRAEGSEFRAGDMLLMPGRILTAPALLAAAASDTAEAKVWRRPRCTILATGDELVEAGFAKSNLRQIPDSVSCGVGALAQEWYATVVDSRRIADDVSYIQQSVRAATDLSDVVVITGVLRLGRETSRRPLLQG